MEALIPSTWSSATAPDRPGRSWAMSRSSGSPSGRITTTPRTTVPVDGDQPTGQPVLEGQRGERRTGGGDVDGLADEEQAGEHVKPISGPCRPYQRSDLSRGELGEQLGPEALGDRRQRVAGVVERLAGTPHVVGPVEEPHHGHRVTSRWTTALSLRCGNARGVVVASVSSSSATHPPLQFDRVGWLGDVRLSPWWPAPRSCRCWCRQVPRSSPRPSWCPAPSSSPRLSLSPERPSPAGRRGRSW